MFYTDKWVFIHIPKTAGNTILLKCQEQNLDTLIVPWDEATRLSRHNPISWWTDRIDLRNRQAYCVVRNPYSRAVSFWDHTIRERNLPNPPSLFDFYNSKPSDPILHWLGNSKWLHNQISYNRNSITWGLFDTQKSFIDPSVKAFHYETELPLLEEKLGVKFTDTRINKGTYRKDYRYYYNSETQELVYNLFKEDFVEYGYDVNL